MPNLKGLIQSAFDRNLLQHESMTSFHLPEWLDLDKVQSLPSQPNRQEIFNESPHSNNENTESIVPYRENQEEGFFPIRQIEENGKLDVRQQTSDSLKKSVIGSEIQKSGVEALAWYLPYHVSRERYGIYIREQGLIFVSEYFRSVSHSHRDFLSDALRLLTLHEEAHCHIESILTNLELIAGKPFYIKRSSVVRTGVGVSKASDPKPIDAKDRMAVTEELMHSLGIDNNQLNESASSLYGLNYFDLEEALANAFAISNRKVNPFQRESMLFADNLQPSGYRDYRSVWPRNPFGHGMKTLLNEAIKTGGFECGLWESVMDWSKRHIGEIPIYLVKDVNPGDGIVFAFRYNGVQVSVYIAKEHQPSHFHVSMPTEKLFNQRYQYPDLSPATKGDIQLTRRQKSMIEEAILRYPMQKFEEELEMQREYLSRKRDRS